MSCSQNRQDRLKDQSGTFKICLEPLYAFDGAYPRPCLFPVFFPGVPVGKTGDKKNQYSEVRMASVGPIGSCQINTPVSQDAFKRAVDYYFG